MGWSDIEEGKKIKEKNNSSKILLYIMACLVLIIIIILALLLTIEKNSFKLSVNGILKEEYNINNLISKVDDKTYIQIESFSKLVGYEYHKGEYKAFTIDDDKCYVQGEVETATFFLNDNKVCKLPVDELTSDYKQFEIQDTVRQINGKMYASLEAIKLAFNVFITEGENALDIYTLDALIKSYNTKAKSWGYTDITQQNFENKKALLYGYLIVKKEGGLYKIIDSNNTKEIVSDKYSSIEFKEDTKEFLVTNSLGQVGIINLDGTTKIEPVYDSISILDKESDLYLIQKGSKYGVVKSGNTTIISPEYDVIGLKSESITNNLANRYIILDKIIPVCKDGKWGAFDKKGNIVYKLEYDGFGCNITNVKIDETEKEVLPVLTIERCNGIIVQKNDSYGMLDINGKELVPIKVESIYALDNTEDEDEKYFMIYNNKVLNVIERLIIAGLIEDPNKEEIETNTNTLVNNTINVDLTNSTNQVTNNITQ